MVSKCYKKGAVRQFFLGAGSGADGWVKGAPVYVP